MSLLTWGTGSGTDGCRQTRRRLRCDQLMWGTWCCLLIFYKCSLHHHGSFQNWRVKKNNNNKTKAKGDIIIFFNYIKWRTFSFNWIIYFAINETHFGSFFNSLLNKVGKFITVVNMNVLQKPLLVSRFMGDGECQTQASVLINGAAPVLAAHPTNWSKPCKKKRFEHQFHYLFIFL